MHSSLSFAEIEIIITVDIDADKTYHIGLRPATSGSSRNQFVGQKPAEDPSFPVIRSFQQHKPEIRWLNRNAMMDYER